MALYFVEHRHSPDTCPARDPRMGAMLLQHLSPANAEQHGVKIQGEAVLDGQHTLVMIVEAQDAEAVKRFMQPFEQAGSVEVKAANHCETVVERGGC